MIFFPHTKKKETEKNCPMFCDLSLARDWKKYFSFQTKNKKEIVH